jgi:predicted phosphodiesterase
MAPHLPDAKPDVAICGHSHIPLLEWVEGVLFLNPGAAGVQPRFGQPLSAALLTLDNGWVSAELITL